MSLYLTKVPLEPIGGWQDSHQRCHTTVMGLFPSGLGEHPRADAGILYRLEPTLGRVLVQSMTSPMAEQIERLNGEMREVDEPAFEEGELLRYRCDVAALKRTKRQERRVPHSEIGSWWQHLLQRNGFALTEPTREHLLGVADLSGADGPQPRLRRASFAGTCVVTDPRLARIAVIGGIGRARSYGCGMLSVAVF